MTFEEMHAVVATAHNHKLKVTGHCRATEGIKNALKVREKVALAVRLRLEYLLPHREAVRRRIDAAQRGKQGGQGLPGERCGIGSLRSSDSCDRSAR